MDVDHSIRVVFFGTADLAVASLRALAAEPSIRILAVVTQPDRPRGRSLKLCDSPVKTAARALDLPILQPVKARATAFLDELRTLAPELIVVAAYGQILSESLLAIPDFGCLNVHASLLPRHRGAAPIQAALLEGDAETGVTIMKMDAGLDTGDMVSSVTTPIDPHDNGSTLHDRLAALGARLLVETIPRFVRGDLTLAPQPAETATYSKKLTREDGAIDWSRPAAVICRRVRAFTPWPGAFTTYLDGDRRRTLKIWRAEPAEGADGSSGVILASSKDALVVGAGNGHESVRLLELQREGGRRLPADQFLRGNPMPAGTRLG